MTREKGGLIAAASHRYASIDEESGKVKTLGEVTNNTYCRFNDGKCDPKGRFWAGSYEDAFNAIAWISLLIGEPILRLREHIV